MTRLEQQATPTSAKLAYSIDRCSDTLSISRVFCYELINSGRLKSVKIGKKRLILHSAIVEFLDDLESEQQGAGPRDEQGDES